jgi:hypothetical protein
MYVQWFVKGIAGQTTSRGPHLREQEAYDMALRGHGIVSNWWRNTPTRTIHPDKTLAVLTEHNLDRHLHDYHTFGPETPFISLASGCVERDTITQQNAIYSAVDTALEFATDAGARPGALFYGWVIVGLNPAVKLAAVAESVRDLNVYHRWSPFQLEGEITAKIHIPANQIQRVEWWDTRIDPSSPSGFRDNPLFTAPTPILNVREHF